MKYAALAALLLLAPVAAFGQSAPPAASADDVTVSSNEGLSLLQRERDDAIKDAMQLAAQLRRATNEIAALKAALPPPSPAPAAQTTAPPPPAPAPAPPQPVLPSPPPS